MFGDNGYDMDSNGLGLYMVLHWRFVLLFARTSSERLLGMSEVSLS